MFILVMNVIINVFIVGFGYLVVVMVVLFVFLVGVVFIFLVGYVLLGFWENY